MVVSSAIFASSTGSTTATSAIRRGSCAGSAVAAYVTLTGSSTAARTVRVTFTATARTSRVPVDERTFTTAAAAADSSLLEEHGVRTVTGLLTGCGSASTSCTDSNWMLSGGESEGSSDQTASTPSTTLPDAATAATGNKQNVGRSVCTESDGAICGKLVKGVFTTPGVERRDLRTRSVIDRAGKAHPKRPTSLTYSKAKAEHQITPIRFVAVVPVAWTFLVRWMM